MSILKHNEKIEFATTADKLKAYLHGDNIQLGYRDKEILERAECAFNIWIKKRSRKKASDLLIVKYKYSLASAYNDLKNAEIIFGSPLNQKEMDRIISKQMASETYDIAKNKRDLEQMNKATANYIKASGADKEDPNLPKPEDFVIPQNVIMIDPDKIEIFLDKYSVNIDAKAKAKLKELMNEIKIIDFMHENVEDIQHEDISNEE